MSSSSRLRMKLNTSNMGIFVRCCSKSCRQCRGEQLLFSPLHGVVHGRLCLLGIWGWCCMGFCISIQTMPRNAILLCQPPHSHFSRVLQLRGIMLAVTRMIIWMVREAYPEDSSSDPMAMKDRMVCPWQRRCY